MATIAAPTDAPQQPQPMPVPPKPTPQPPANLDYWRKFFHKLIDKVFDALSDPSFWIIA